MATTQLRWRASFSASCLHAAACLARGLPAADATIGATVRGPAAALDHELREAGWNAAKLYPTLVALAADYENNRELVVRAARHWNLPADPDLPSIGRIAGAIADLEAAVRRSQPHVVEELAVRGRPLQEQWEARGPGILAEIGRLTDPRTVPEFAEVVLVAPLVGGHGWAHVERNRVTFEALLVNPTPELPEVVRLAWLVAQLAADQPPLADVLDRPTAERVVPLAVLPPVLAAAHGVELVGPLDEALVETALTSFRVNPAAMLRIAGTDQKASPAAPAMRSIAATMWTWWQTWVEGPGRWEVAVAALAQLLPPPQP